MDHLSGLSKVGYIAACVLVPALWGALCAWLFTRRDKQREAEELERRPPVDYMI